MKEKGIFFDLYGTLFIYGDMQKAWNSWEETFIQKLMQYEVELEFSQGVREFWKSFFSKEKLIKAPNGLTFFEYRVKKLAETVGSLLKKEALSDIALSCLQNWQEYMLLDQKVKPVLKELQKRMELALISNFNHTPHVVDILDSHGLSSYFNSITVSEAVGHEKPDPLVFEEAFLHTPLKRENVYYVGDSSVDIKGAIAAGMKPVLIERESRIEDVSAELKEQAIVIKDFEELLDLE